MTARPDAPELSAAEREFLDRPDEPESLRERMAVAIYGRGAYCGDCPYDGWDTCPECRRYVREYADAALAVVRGETS